MSAAKELKRIRTLFLELGDRLLKVGVADGRAEVGRLRGNEKVGGGTHPLILVGGGDGQQRIKLNTRDQPKAPKGDKFVRAAWSRGLIRRGGVE